MEFGKVQDPSRINFQFPSDDLGNTDLLARFARPSITPPQVFVGAPVWGSKAWEGTIFPQKTPPQERLDHYAKAFTTIELNATHYRIPELKTVSRWLSQVSGDFRFVPKVFQGISHDRLLVGTEELVRDFTDSVRAMGDHRGPCFLQLPPSFAPDERKRLENFFKQWPQDIKLAVEFRHPKCFSNHRLDSALKDLLIAHEVGTVITDVSGRRDVLHMTLTMPFVLIRFIGNALHPTDYPRIDDWTKRLHSWLEDGLQETYFFVHQPEDAGVPELARYFVEQLNKETGLTLPTWSPLPPPQNQQLTLL